LAARIDLLRQLKNLGVISIDFTGGEPLLYPGLPKLIRIARQMGFFTSLTTNGTLYKKYAHQLKGNLSALSFSLDSADKATHNKIRGINCYDKTIKSIILARRLGETVMLKTTVCNRYMSSIPPLIKLTQRMGILIELNAEFSYFSNPKLRDQNIRQVFKWWKEPNVIISHAHLHFMLNHGNDVEKPKCFNGSTVIVLSPNDGIFLPCMHKVYNVIPLENHRLRTTLESERMKNEREWMGRHPYCQGCTIPCYFEPVYYTQIDKYWAISLWSRLGYIRKRIVLGLKNKFSA